MKLSNKFLEDLHKIGEDAFIEKNQWIGKLVPDIIIDNLQKRGISQEDIEGVVCLSVEEAEILTRCAANEFCRLILEHAPVELARQVEVLMYDLVKRIEQAEKRE